METDKKPPSHEQTLAALHGAPETQAKLYAEAGGLQNIPPGKVETVTKSDAGQGEDLESLTVSDLHERAKDLGLTGYSTLHKDELVKAVRKAQKKA